MSFNAIIYYFFINHCHGLCSLVTCFPRVNLQQITLIRGYIRPNEQPVVFIP